ncbi:MAG: SH3 domain-containing protein [Deltaproteobacteria bacterium]|nr:SH3 domain-containing protein [Deltaproteobacteria bacterium]
MLQLFRVPASAILVFLCCVAMLGGCATREDTGLREQPRFAHMRDVEDLRRLPQDLTVYAQRIGKDRRLLSQQEQARQDARFDRIFFSPWQQAGAAVTAKALALRFGKGPQGFTENARPWTREEWDGMRANANLGSYPCVAQPGITLRHTFIRELPSTRPRMTTPRPFGRDNPFDMFQYSSLFLGTPLYAAHISADGAWYFVDTPIASGWVSAEDVALVDASFMAQYRNGRYAAVIRDDLPLATKAGVIGHTHIGAVYPLHKEHARGINVLAPVRGSQGQAVIAAVALGSDQAKVKPLPLNPAWLARVGNQMLGQPYGWGGLYAWRDCSSTVRDIFAPFGIWLPRNSAAQGRSGSVIMLEGLNGADKEQLISASGVPFMSLLWLRGHIMLYLGQYRNESVVFHNIWGLRVVEGGDDDARHVLGRAVVSSLRIGWELPALKDSASLLERLGAMITLPGYGAD